MGPVNFTFIEPNMDTVASQSVCFENGRKWKNLFDMLLTLICCFKKKYPLLCFGQISDPIASTQAISSNSSFLPIAVAKLLQLQRRRGTADEIFGRWT